MKRLVLVVAGFLFVRPVPAADILPTLQWVKTAGGSGANSVAVAAADSHGNLYVVGSTTSLDFPTVGPASTTPGGSTLARVNLSTGSAARLFPASLPSITAAAADPENPGTLYAASHNQIWKSVDAGSTWSMLSAFPSSVDVVGLAVDPGSHSVLYAGTFSIGVQKSTDGGLNWTAANTGIPVQAGGSTVVGNVWVDPSDSNVILAATGYGLERSSSAGGNWTNVAPGNPFSALVFDPSTPGSIYFGNGPDILKSTDHGATFTRISSLPNFSGTTSLMLDPHHPGVLYAGSTAGIYQSSDGGSTWKLQQPGVPLALAADPNSSALYGTSVSGIVKSTDGFATATPLGPNQPSIVQFLISGHNLFAISSATSDVFAMKLDNNGNVVYSTYFGGGGSDQAVALAVAPDGSVYIAGSTNSADLPGTTGAFQSKLPQNSYPLEGFICKLNAAGGLAWTTYFPESNITSVAVDASGNPTIAGNTKGGIPTTPGAYQTTFQQTVTSNGFFAVIGPTSAFVTRFNAQGSGLLFSTYVPTDTNGNVVEQAQGLVVDPAGNTWFGVVVNNTIAAPGVSSPSVVELNPSGSAILASAVKPGLGNVAALAFDADSNVYIAGSYATQVTAFPATQGAFQAVPQPEVPALEYQSPSGGGQDAFVAKWDHSLTHLLAATLLGGELVDGANSIAIDGSGNVIVGGLTASAAFPTHAPFQEAFSSLSGFVAAFDPSLSNLLFSTYLGDGRPFEVAAAVPDGNGNLLLAGSTIGSGSSSAGSPTAGLGSLVVANKIGLTATPSVRLDSVQNYASRMALPLTPDEPILVQGSGFGASAQVVLDGTPLTSISATGTAITALVPLAASASGAHTIQVSNGGILSNPVYVPAASTSPGVYTADGSGVGQAYVLNSDGSMNSPSNPAATGSAITILIAGAGPFTVTDGYAVTPQPPAVYIDGLYCNGIAAKVGSVNGLPGDVYQLSVFVPDPAALVANDPDLKNFTFPPQSSIQVRMGPSSSPAASQSGVFINVK